MASLPAATRARPWRCSPVQPGQTPRAVFSKSWIVVPIQPETLEVPQRKTRALLQSGLARVVIPELQEPAFGSDGSSENKRSERGIAALHIAPLTNSHSGPFVFAPLT